MRIPEPGPHRVAVGRERVPKHRRMCRNTTPVRLRVGEDNPHARRDWVPAAVAGNPGGKTPIAVDRAEQRLDVDEIGLELDDQQQPSPGEPREDVDHAALAIDREAHLGHGDPAGEGRKETRERLMERGVACSEEPVRVSAAPTADEVNTDVERGQDASERPDRQCVQMSPFDEGHEARGNRGGRGEIDLPPTAPLPHRSHECAESLVVHVAQRRQEHSSGAYLGRIRRLSACGRRGATPARATYPGFVAFSEKNSGSWPPASVGGLPTPGAAWFH